MAFPRYERIKIRPTQDRFAVAAECRDGVDGPAQPQSVNNCEKSPDSLMQGVETDGSLAV